jgi:hypothetical protein
MHPSVRKATALSSLPPLMTHYRQRCQLLGSTKAQALLREFCSKHQFDNRVPVSEEKLVLWLQDIVLQLHISTKSTRKRRDTPPVRPRTRAAAILLTANDMHNRGFVEDLEKGGIGEGMYIARWFSARRPLNGKAARCCGSRSVQFPGPRLPDAGRMAGYGMPIIVEGE